MIILDHAQALHAQNQTLVNDFETPAEQAECSVSSGATQTFITSGPGITHGTHALRVMWTANATNYPGEKIAFAAEDWSHSGGLALDVTNPGTQDTQFSVRMDDSTGANGPGNINCLNASYTVTAGSTVHLVYPLIPAEPPTNYPSTTCIASISSSLGMLSGIPSAPLAFPVAPTSAYLGPVPVLSKMVDVIIFLGLVNPSTNRTLVFDNLHLVPGPTSTLGTVATTEVNDFETTAQQSGTFYSAQGVTYEYDTTSSTPAAPAAAITSGTHCLEVDFTAGSGVSNPGLTTYATNLIGTPAAADWLGQNALGVAVDVFNPNTGPVTFDIVLQSATGNYYRQGTATIAGGQILPVHYVIPLYSNQPLNLSGFTDMTATGGLPPTYDFQHILYITYDCGATAPANTTKLYFDNVRLVTTGNTTASSLVTDSIDPYGQNNLADWSGKVHSTADFATDQAAESLDLSQNPPPSDRDLYGGYANGPTEKVTGYFHTQQVTDSSSIKWWLVDPAGKLFYGVGMTTMDPIDPTETVIKPTSGSGLDRTAMFDYLPLNSDDPLYPFWASYNGGYGPFNTSSNQTFNFYGANLYRKYGSSWETNWLSNSVARIWSWGFNMVGDFSTAPITAPNKTSNQVPYSVGLLTNDYYGVGNKTITGTIYGSSVTLPDPWDPKFATTCADGFGTDLYNISQYKNDPYLIGYFVDNEFGWGVDPSAPDYSNNTDRFPMVYAVMALVASSSPAKTQLLSMLQSNSEYGTIAALNADWGTNFASWTDPNLLNSYALSTTLTTTQQKYFDIYMQAFAAQYANVVDTAIKALDTHHLYLGCKFEGQYWSLPVAQGIATYADVVSFDIYDSGTNLNTNYAILDELTKPTFIGEYSFSAASDVGGFADSTIPLVACANQAARATAFQGYMAGALTHAGLVGCTWFQYTDEPNSGRIYEGENATIGWVSVADVPYAALRAQARISNATIYSSRFIKALATVTLGNLADGYSGASQAATATTNPPGLNVTFTYNGSSTPPTNPGTYTVVATVNDPNYQGTATGTLVISGSTDTPTMPPWAVAVLALLLLSTAARFLPKRLTNE